MSYCLFAYGTLEDPRRLQTLTGHHYPGRMARLEGYRCARVKGARYPGVIATPGRHTDGTLFCGLNGRALRRLDRYEGRLYRRESRRVVDGDGQAWMAEVYVVPAAKRRHLTAHTWRPMVVVGRASARLPNERHPACAIRFNPIIA